MANNSIKEKDFDALDDILRRISAGNGTFSEAVLLQKIIRERAYFWFFAGICAGIALGAGVVLL